MSKITPIILGSGRSGKAIAKSLAVLNILNPDLEIAPSIFLKRGTPLTEERKNHQRVLFCIANPHGLHADSILEADRAGVDAIICEKPACVNTGQLEKLQAIKSPTAILHAYRQMWGPQTIKKMIDNGEFGKVITIEGRYWHGSAASHALSSGQSNVTNWKNDVRLSGESDTYIDLATHLLDSMCFLHGSFEPQIHGWRSYINAAATHRDTHVHVTMNLPKDQRASGSISKAVHGSPNHFELNVIGEKKYAKWEFLMADEIHFGIGKDRSILTRKETGIGSQQDPYHAMGWLEGYIEIARQLIRKVFQGQTTTYPTLNENLKLLNAMFNTKWE